jgi:hypothetical protein
LLLMAIRLAIRFILLTTFGFCWGLDHAFALTQANASPPLATFSPSATVHWGTREGLPHSVIKALVQAPDGRLWLGTQEGLSCFDGDHWV